jgi:hypothetical protein
LTWSRIWSEWILREDGMKSEILNGAEELDTGVVVVFSVVFIGAADASEEKNRSKMIVTEKKL